MKPPGESARGFVPGFPSPARPRRYFQRGGKKREGRGEDGEETSHLSCCANVMEFLPTSIEHLVQKVAHYRRGTSLVYWLSVQYELSSYRRRHKLYLVASSQ